jgi:hypothetical protein
VIVVIAVAAIVMIAVMETVAMLTIIIVMIIIMVGITTAAACAADRLQILVIQIAHKLVVRDLLLAFFAAPRHGSFPFFRIECVFLSSELSILS